MLDLDPALRSDFDRWLGAAVARFVPPLSFQEVRKGVRAVSALYVERRAEGGASRVLQGEGKRAAFATYYAPLHFLTAHHAALELRAAGLVAPRRILDLGCGSGVAGAALARACESVPEVQGIDRSSFALGEARHTHAAFRLRGRGRRGVLPAALPRARRGDLMLLGWAVNELSERDRDGLLAGLQRGLAAGAQLLVLEPLAGSAVPWWGGWCEALAALGVVPRELRTGIERPDWIVRLDTAAGLLHREVGCRALVGPCPATPR